MGKNLLPFFKPKREHKFHFFESIISIPAPSCSTGYSILRQRPEMVFQVAPRNDTQAATGNRTEVAQSYRAQGIRGKEGVVFHLTHYTEKSTLNKF